MKKPPLTKKDLMAEIGSILYDLKAAARDLTQLNIHYHFSLDHPEMCEQEEVAVTAIDTAEEEVRDLLALVNTALTEIPKKLRNELPR